MAVIKRPELIKMISEKMDREYPQKEIYFIVQATFRCFEDILRNGDKLVVGDCFTMEPLLKKEREMSNFGKEKIVTPAHYVPHFRPYKKLKDACNAIPVEDTLSHNKEVQYEDNRN
ncbi:HU family DNA-binding protein [Frisingicoccus sp.]|uniref:HU family DNA-binding protein n=1 Tax=Frisingicoccus sp. TaxID=1918627 RepID=UPI003999B785